MQQALDTLAVSTRGAGLYEITDDVAGWVRRTGFQLGLLTVFCRHTSAGLLITENASPAVWRDLQRWMSHVVPEGDHYEHSDEGPDDMPAHLKSVLTGNSVTVPVSDGRIMLGTWQGLFLAEFRRAPHRRSVVMHLAGQ